MLRKLTLLFTLILMTGISLSIYGQSVPKCGTSSSDLNLIQERLIKNKASLYSKETQINSRSRETIFIPLKFHLAATDNGSGRVRSSDVFDQLCYMNETFSDLGVQFYVKDGFNLIDNTQIFDNSTILAIKGIMNSIRAEDAINIYVVRDVQDPQASSVGTTLGAYDPGKDWIIIEQTEIKSGKIALLHEIGHFFSLLHPFNGWDKEPYDPELHGSPATEAASNGSLAEYADGSNCETAGDMICDTPADYLYWTKINNDSCAYSEPIIDAQGDTLRPDSELIMSYFLDKCSNKFTPMQVALMIEDYESEARTYLKNNEVVTSGSIADEPVTILSPSDNGTVSTAGLVDLEWESLDGATAYYLELYTIRNSGGSTLVHTTIVTTTNASVSVDIGRDYRWRIKPINGVNYCASYTKLRTFKTDMASSIPEVGSVESWTVQPNPLNKKTFVTVSILANEAFEADIKITDLSGRIIQNNNNNNFSIGLNKVRIPLNNLVKGIYIISIETNLGISHKKIVVQ